MGEAASKSLGAPARARSLDARLGRACRAGGAVLALGCWSCSSGEASDGGTGDGEARDVGARDGSVDSRGVRESGPRDGGPHETSIEAAPPHPVVAVPLTGCAESTYLASVEIGSQVFELNIDTASTTLAVAAAGCKSCPVAPRYTPGSTAVDEHAQAKSEYCVGCADAGLGGSSGWSGEIYEDDVSAGGASAPMRFVAIDAQSQFFYPFYMCGSSKLSYQGILGLALAKNEVAGTDGYIDELVAEESFPDVFATELCETGGQLWLGGYDPAYVTGPPVYTPYFTSADPTKYAVYLKSVAVAGKSADVPTARSPLVTAYLDTGDGNFYLPPLAFSTVANAITSSAGFSAAFGADAGGPDAGGAVFSPTALCLTTTLTKDQLDSTLPPITIVFGSSPSASITAVATEAYLVPFPSGGVMYWCPGMFELIVPETVGPYLYTAILGTSILRSSVVIYDREHNRIGFAPHTPCP